MNEQIPLQSVFPFVPMALLPWHTICFLDREIGMKRECSSQNQIWVNSHSLVLYRESSSLGLFHTLKDRRSSVLVDFKVLSGTWGQWVSHAGQIYRICIRLSFLNWQCDWLLSSKVGGGPGLNLESPLNHRKCLWLPSPGLNPRPGSQAEPHALFQVCF